MNMVVRAEGNIPVIATSTLIKVVIRVSNSAPKATPTNVIDLLKNIQQRIKTTMHVRHLTISKPPRA